MPRRGGAPRACRARWRRWWQPRGPARATSRGSSNSGAPRSRQPGSRRRPWGRGRAELAAAGIETEYLEARDATTLAPAQSLNGRPVLVAVAARVGKARLIDNTVIGG